MGSRFEDTGRGYENVIGGERYENREAARIAVISDWKTWFPNLIPGQEVKILRDDGDNFTLQSVTGDTVTEIKFVDNTPKKRFISSKAKTEPNPQ